MQNTEKKAALEGILIMLMHSGQIEIFVELGEIEPNISHIARANIIDTMTPFCDTTTIMEDALDSLSGNKEFVQVMLDSGANRDVKKAELMMAIDKFVEDSIYEDFEHDTFTQEEFQAIYRKHPDFYKLVHQDMINNPQGSYTDQDFDYKKGRAG